MTPLKTVLLTLSLSALLLGPTGAWAQSGGHDPDAIDYSVLYKAPYTYADLMRAKALDLSDTQVAQVAKIAEITGRPFDDVVDAVRLQGRTFVTLAGEYGFPLSALSDVRREKDQISDYISAYETSGEYAVPVGPPAASAPHRRW